MLFQLVNISKLPEYARVTAGFFGIHYQFSLDRGPMPLRVLHILSLTKLTYLHCSLSAIRLPPSRHCPHGAFTPWPPPAADRASRSWHRATWGCRLHSRHVPLSQLGVIITCTAGRGKSGAPAASLYLSLTVVKPVFRELSCIPTWLAPE